MAPFGGEDLYYEHPHLMTPSEKADMDHDMSQETTPTLPPQLKTWMLELRPTAEAATRRQFEKRPPALGATPEILEAVEAQARVLREAGLDVQQRLLYKMLRSSMLRQLISCNGCRTTEELVAVLRKELMDGIVIAPEWYKFSTVTMGPRKIGYDSCCARDCYATETAAKKFPLCSRCKMAVYCGRDCQRADWHARHKSVCREAAEKSEMLKKVGNMLQGLSDMSMEGQDDLFGGDLQALIAGAKDNPAVQERRAKLRAERDRPKSENATGEPIDFFKGRDSRE